MKEEVGLGSHYLALATKRLSLVDADPKKSNQHEIGGLIKAKFGEHLGLGQSDTVKFAGRFFYFREDLEDISYSEGTLSWYDSRRGNARRSAEYRLYYDVNLVTDSMMPGDLLILGLTVDSCIHFMVAEQNTSAEIALTKIFDVSSTPNKTLTGVEVPAASLSLLQSYLFEVLGVGAGSPTEIPDWEDLVTARFGTEFPATSEFSEFARLTVGDLDVVGDPDDVLLQWMMGEERLFRALEKASIEDRLSEGFEDVDSFISYSLSVQNRRKSRAGLSFESHIEVILEAHGIDFERGKLTENRSKPDFLFPSVDYYHKAEARSESLIMLGAKTSCKDRWRQVLSEAAKIPYKHLITVQPAISSTQLEEMKTHNLQLVVPKALHETYAPE